MSKRLAIVAAGIAALTLFTGLLRADDPAPQPSQDQLAAIASSLKWQTGTVSLRGDLAKINLGDKFRFLDHENAEKVLHDLWGNPPDDATLGMIFPNDVGPLDHGSWGVIISYEENG